MPDTMCHSSAPWLSLAAPIPVVPIRHYNTVDDNGAQFVQIINQGNHKMMHTTSQAAQVENPQFASQNIEQQLRKARRRNVQIIMSQGHYKMEHTTSQAAQVEHPSFAFQNIEQQLTIAGNHQQNMTILCTQAAISLSQVKFNLLSADSIAPPRKDKLR